MERAKFQNESKGILGWKEGNLKMKIGIFRCGSREILELEVGRFQNKNEEVLVWKEGSFRLGKFDCGNVYYQGKGNSQGSQSKIRVRKALTETLSILTLTLNLLQSIILLIEPP